MEVVNVCRRGKRLEDIGKGVVVVMCLRGKEEEYSAAGRERVFWDERISLVGRFESDWILDFRGVVTKNGLFRRF